MIYGDFWILHFAILVAGSVGRFGDGASGRFGDGRFGDGRFGDSPPWHEVAD
jgi:hypothetical protein